VQFFTKKAIKNLSHNELNDVKKWINSHFKFMDVQKRYSCSEALMAAEKYHKVWPFTAMLIDPYNALSIKLNGLDTYSYHVANSNAIQNWTTRVAGVVVNAHITSGSARSSRNGTRPTIEDVEFGMPFISKAHDGIVIHRHLDDAHRVKVTEISVEKVKRIKTGGYWTPREEPIELQLNFDPFEFTGHGTVEREKPVNYLEQLDDKEVEKAPF
jgi:hypothetical protein